MAKKPPRARRAVAPVPPKLLQPGSVGVSLKTRETGGVVPLEDELLEHDGQAKSKAEKREKFLAVARKRFRSSAEYESQLRKEMLDDLRFYNSDQWPDQIRNDRALDGRPVLTINRLPQFVRQVLNQARQQRPAIQVSPIDNGADPDTAEVVQGICRSIERNSKAGMAYTTAGEYQVIIGRGWLRIRADWIEANSFDQEIIIESPEDPFTVYPDVAAGKPDGSDANWGFIVARMPWHEYHARWPNAERISFSDFTSIGDDAPDWVSESGVLVAEYYYIETVPTELCECELLIEDGQPPQKLIVYRDMIRDEDLKPDEETGMPRLVILRRRATLKRQLKWAAMNGIDILDGNEDKTAGRNLPGSFIPLVPMIGEKLVVNGKRNLRGMVRDAKDPQRTYNFWVSAETEMIALAPRAPVIGAVGQFESTKEQWLLANRRNFPFLEYDAVDVNGALVPPPQRNQFDANVSPIVAATQQADHDLKSILGMFDASQERSREQSGKAIIARQQQGEQGNSHFLNNQAMAIEQVGRILLQWIPIYYDRPKMVRILGVDDRERDVMVHAGNPQAAEQQMAEAKQDPVLAAILGDDVFDVGLGRYDVSISTAPSFQSRRGEAVEAIIQLLQAFPLAAPYSLDVLAKNMDWPGARELSERFKHLVPPEARSAEDGAKPIPPEVQQQLAMLNQQLELLQQQAQEQQRIIDTKAQELAAQGQIRQMEIAAQERMAEMKAQLEMSKLTAQFEADRQLEILKGRIDALAQKAEHFREDRPDTPQQSLNYKDAPPDVRRQMEEEAGYEPSRMGDLAPPAKLPAGPPTAKPAAGAKPAAKPKPKAKEKA